MQIHYKNKRLEKVIIGVNLLVAAVIAATFVVRFGFSEPQLPVQVLYLCQLGLLAVLMSGKIIRMFNVVSSREFWRANWFEIPLLLGLGFSVSGAGYWFAKDDPETVRHFAVGIYLVF